MKVLITFDTLETNKKDPAGDRTPVFTLAFFKVLCSIVNNSEALDKLLRFTKPWSPHLPNRENNLFVLSMLAWESMQKGVAGCQAPGKASMSDDCYYFRNPVRALKTICFVYYTLAIVF